MIRRSLTFGLFLRLLALPASRFGLEETLDLLASPPLAAANGLVAEDFERLRGWLQARPLLRADLEGEPEDMLGLGLTLQLATE